MIDRDTDIEIADKGSFYRNICEDIIEMEYLKTSVVSVSLSRDGIYQLLPEALFFHEDRLLATRESNYTEELKRLKDEKEVLSTFFKPFDTTYFECSAFLEEVVEEMALRKNDILLNLLYDYDSSKEENRHIKQLAPLLPYAFEIRGDLKFLQQVLQAIFKEKVEISLIYRQQYPFVEDSIDSPLQVFTFHVKGLNMVLYKQMMDELAAFFPFFAEYFLPFDVDYIFKVRDIEQVFLLEKPLILDYNTQLS